MLLYRAVVLTEGAVQLDDYPLGRTPAQISWGFPVRLNR